MSDIAINPVTRRVQFTGNTGTGPFAFTFNVLNSSDIAVYKNTTLLTLTTDYTVTVAANGTGSVTLQSGQAVISSDYVTIIGGRNLERTTDFVTAGDLLASSLNEQLDSNVIMSQQLDESFGRALSVSPGDVDVSMTLPAASSRANQIVAFTSTGAVTTTNLNTLPELTVDKLNVDNITLDGNTISTTDSNGNLILTPNGTGDVVVSGDIVINGTTTTNNFSVSVVSISDGSSSAPSLTNTGNTNTGLFFPANNQVGISASASEIVNISTTGVKISPFSGSNALVLNNNDTSIGDNNAIARIIATADDPTADQEGAEILFLSAGAWSTNSYPTEIVLRTDNGGSLTNRMVVGSTGIDVTGTVTATGTSVFASLDISGDIDVDGTTNLDVVDIDGAVNMADTALVTGVLTTTAAAVFNGGFAAGGVGAFADGSNSAPSLTNTGDTNTGLYFPAADEVGLTVGGTQRLNVSATGIDVTGTAVTDGLTVAGNLSVDGGTIKLDGNYPVGTDNVALGDTAFDAVTSGIQNTAIGANSMTANTSGTNNSAVGRSSMAANTTGSELTALGTNSLVLNTTGSYNTALGSSALYSNTTASNNTAVGYQAGYATTTGERNTAVGTQSLYTNTTGSFNAAFGRASMYFNTTGQQNVALGQDVLFANSTGSYNVAVGKSALQTNTTANYNTAVGYAAGLTVTTGVENTLIGGLSGDALTVGYQNVALGYQALTTAQGSSANVAIGVAALATANSGATSSATYNTAVGHLAGTAVTTGVQNTLIGGLAGDAITTGGSNVALGAGALGANTTASNNTAVGYQTAYSNTTGVENVAMGNQALYSNTTGYENIAIGRAAGYENTTGFRNTYIGDDANQLATTGSNNTVIGRFNGNQGGLDIRTSSNNIVLSDGDGNPRLYIDSSANVIFCGGTAVPSSSASGAAFDPNTNGRAILKLGTTSTGNQGLAEFFNPNGQVGGIVVNGSATSYNTSSDYRLKENVTYDWDATTRLKQLKPSRFNFIADADTTVDGFLAHEVSSIVPEAITGTKDAVDEDGKPEYQSIDQSKLVPLLVKTIQELEARITALEG